MKRIIIICVTLIISLLFVSCTSLFGLPKEEPIDTYIETEESMPPFITEYNIDNVPYEEGDFDSHNNFEQYHSGEGVYEGDVLPDKESAVKAAKGIFEAISERSDLDEFTPLSIFYDPDDKIWVITFCKQLDKSSGWVHLGDSCSVALKSTDAQVVAIWFEE